MEEKKKFLEKPSGSEIYIAASIAVYYGIELLCKGLFYGVMTGREGLINIILAIVLKWISALCIAIPPFIFGARFISSIRQDL